MYDRILVPLDGSKLARQALPYASAVAAAKPADVELVAVIEPIEEIAKPHMGEYAEYFRNEALRQLADSADLLGEGINVSRKVLEGDAAEAIITEAGQQPETLIVMATHGRSGIGRWRLGSVTDKVIRHAEHPTLVIRARDDEDAAPPTLREVILPLDGSAIAEAAIPHAVEMAQVLGVGISLVRAVSPMSYAEEYLPEGYERIAEGARENAEDYLEATAARIREQAGTSVSTEAILGNADSMIIDAAQRSGDALIVMTTHGRSGVGRWVLGSVTDRVVRHSHSPVLVVRLRTAA